MVNWKKKDNHTSLVDRTHPRRILFRRGLTTQSEPQTTH
ncbi:hypothetical protein NIES2104_04490 [Leptolyngbya sp. NIES-2104]|nr:hypothetical protein NIES2104_04490 [Leptolyngbya sp. NIES-2104]